MTSLKTSIKTITYLSDIGCLEIQGASLKRMHSHSIAWRKRVIDKAIIVLGALIALLELIRFLLQLLN